MHKTRDIQTRMIIDFHVPHDGLAETFTSMELDELKHVLRLLDDNYLEITSLSTGIPKHYRCLRKN